MPDIVITGHKKCGTKAMLTFLLQHPKIVGTREEFHWHNTWNFNHDFKSFLGHIDMSNKRQNIELEPESFLVTKTGNSAIQAIAENGGGHGMVFFQYGIFTVWHLNTILTNTIPYKYGMVFDFSVWYFVKSQF